MIGRAPIILVKTPGIITIATPNTMEIKALKTGLFVKMRSGFSAGVIFEASWNLSISLFMCSSFQ